LKFYFIQKRRQGDDITEQEESIKRVVEWAEEESKRAKALDEFKNSQVHFNIKNRVGEKDYTMSEEQWKRFRQVWESYGVKFTNDDGTYKSLYEVLCEMSSVWQRLNEENQRELTDCIKLFMKPRIIL